MLFSVFIWTLSWDHVVSSCKYITHQSRSYELDTCSHSDYLTNNSWGFFCQEVNDSKIAVFRQWDGIGCPANVDPSVQLYEFPCNGGDDECYCNGIGTAQEDCSIATMVLEGCDDYVNQTVTKYVINLCEITGEDTSKSVVCEGGNSLRTMSYENEECGEYGFGINDGEFDLDCGYIVCQSSSKTAVPFITFAVVLVTSIWS